MKLVLPVLVFPSLMVLSACSAEPEPSAKPSDPEEQLPLAAAESEETPAEDEPPLDDTGVAESNDDDPETDDTGDPLESVEEEEEEEQEEEEEVPEVFEPTWPDTTDPFADAVVEFTPGPDAGFGAEFYPEIVLGSPEGRGATAGSLDVLSLGELGSIVLEMTDLVVEDGPGPDLIVFENAFSGWPETATVEVSADGEDWVGWPCEPENAEDDFPGCAGVAPVFATGEFLVDPTDPVQAGGDAFDLADVGLTTARFIRITDSGFNALGYGGISGGFDLDAVVAANWVEAELR